MYIFIYTYIHTTYIYQTYIPPISIYHTNIQHISKNAKLKYIFKLLDVLDSPKPKLTVRSSLVLHLARKVQLN